MIPVVHHWQHAVLAGTNIQVLGAHNDHLLVYRRARQGQSLVVLANFSEQRIRLTPDFLESVVCEVL